MLRFSYFILCVLLCSVFSAFADTTESSDSLPIEKPNLYLCGTFSNNKISPDYKLTHTDSAYTISLAKLNGLFQIVSEDSTLIYSCNKHLLRPTTIVCSQDESAKIWADKLTDVSIAFTLPNDSTPDATLSLTCANNHNLISGTLPVIYINVFDEDGNFNDEIIDRNLNHKNYFSGEYWLDASMVTDADSIALYESFGSPSKPLPLEIKARGNSTMRNYSKKPFKLKLGKKQNLLGMTPAKSKHYALIAHADDNTGYLRNFVGFDLAKRIQLPWTPQQQPVEVIINGDYRGVYFLTESIRVGDGRIDIEELADEETDPSIISGGYLVELDNSAETNQIGFFELGGSNFGRVTFDTPEIYSPIQKRFITNQFTAIDAHVALGDSLLWSYLDLDDAARYWLVNEIAGHLESYSGSTYLFRKRGENQKWHFSPVWDFGHAFEINPEDYTCNVRPDSWMGLWHKNLIANPTFKAKVAETWLWFMSNHFEGLYDDIDAYIEQIKGMVEYESARWSDVVRPDSGDAIVPLNVTNPQNAQWMNQRRDFVKNFIQKKCAWLSNQFGEYDSVQFPEPERDDSPAAPIPTNLFFDESNCPHNLVHNEAHIYVVNTAGWDDVYIYFAAGTEHGTSFYIENPDFPEWPGIKMEKNKNLYFDNISGIYDYKIPKELISNQYRVIVNNGKGELNSKTNPFDRFPMWYKDCIQIFPGVAQWSFVILNGENYIDRVVKYDAPWSNSLPVISITTDNGTDVGESAIAMSYRVDPIGNSNYSSLVSSDLSNSIYALTSGIKPDYKIKFNKKASPLGLPKGKHFMLLSWSDDAANGFMGNIAGSKIAQLLGLSWTPRFEPVELMLNGKYRGLYFLVENIRPGSDRIDIPDTDDETYNPSTDWIIRLSSSDETTPCDYTVNNISATAVHPASTTWEASLRDFSASFPSWTTEAYAESLQNNVRDLINIIDSYHTDDNTADIDVNQLVRYIIVNEILDNQAAFNRDFHFSHSATQPWRPGPAWNLGSSLNVDNKTTLIISQNGLPIVSELWQNNSFVSLLKSSFKEIFHDLINNKNSITSLSDTDDSSASAETSETFLNEVNTHIDAAVARLSDAVTKDATLYPGQAATSTDNSLSQRAERAKTVLKNNLYNLAEILGSTTTQVFNPEEDAATRLPRYFNISGIELSTPPAQGIYIEKIGENVFRRIAR